MEFKQTAVGLFVIFHIFPRTIFSITSVFYSTV